MLVLFALVALVSGAEAVKIMNYGEFNSFRYWGSIEDLGDTGAWSDETHVYTKPLNFGDLGITFGNEDGFKGWISICLIYVYILLTPIEFIGLILLILTLFIITLAILSKSKKTKQNEEEQGAKQ